MNLAIERDRHPWCTGFIVFFSMVYVFLFQLNYPFRPDLFLYAAFFFFLVLVLVTSKIIINTNFFLFVSVVIIASAGALYTSLPGKGIREAIFFIILAAMSISMINNRVMVSTIVKWIYIFSIISSITVIIEFVVPDWFLSLMRRVLRSDALEQLLWSYQVDNAYAGIAAYTSFTGYFATIVFGQSFVNFLISLEGRILFKSKKTNVVLMVIAISVTVFSSKRSLFLACILATIIVLGFVNRNNSDFVLKLIVGSLLGFLLAYILYNTNDMFASFMDRFSGDDITTGRGDIYASAWKSFNEGNIFFGKGTGAAYEIFNSGLHNIYLQILYNHGYIGFLVFIILFIHNYAVAIKSKCLISIFVQSIYLVYGMSGNPLYSFSHTFIYIVYSQYTNVYIKMMNDSKTRGDLNVTN